MRTVEAALGLFVIAASIALAFGAARLIAPVPAPGLGVTLALAGIGAALTAHGLTGRALKYGNHDGARSWRIAFYLFLALTLAAALPVIADVFNLASLAGFPLGYYMAAQGVLVLLAVLAFRAATHLDTLDATDDPASARPGEGM